LLVLMVVLEPPPPLLHPAKAAVITKHKAVLFFNPS